MPANGAVPWIPVTVAIPYNLDEMTLEIEQDSSELLRYLTSE